MCVPKNNGAHALDLCSDAPYFPYCVRVFPRIYRGETQSLTF